MPRLRTTVLVLTAVAAVLTAGCMPKMTVAEMKAMMPEKPSELKQLNDFVGKWSAEGTAQFAFLDEPLTTSGTSETTWDESGWFVVERGEFTMGDFDPVRMLMTWTWDTKSKKYRSTWTDSMGGVGIGSARYDADNKTWHIKATGYGPFGKSNMKGTAKLVDGDTFEWTWTEHMGLTKILEMTGTNRRQR